MWNNTCTDYHLFRSINIHYGKPRASSTSRLVSFWIHFIALQPRTHGNRNNYDAFDAWTKWISGCLLFEWSMYSSLRSTYICVGFWPYTNLFLHNQRLGLARWSFYSGYLLLNIQIQGTSASEGFRSATIQLFISSMVTHCRYVDL